MNNNLYYEKDGIIIYNGNCFDILPNIEEKFDLILTDPPYGVTSCNWDITLDLNKLWKILNYISKNNSTYVFTASQPFTSKLIMSNLKHFKYSWIWEKTKPTGFSHSKNMPLKDYEDIVIFSNGSIGHKHLIKNRMTYNPQGVHNIKRKIKRTKKGFDGTMERESQVNEYIGELSGFPKMIIKFNNVIKNNVHPTQKPLDLMEYLIKTYSNENDVILDPFMGSGTTLIAAKKLNRKCIGIELNEKYCEVAIKRLNEI